MPPSSRPRVSRFWKMKKRMATGMVVSSAAPMNRRYWFLWPNDPDVSWAGPVGA